VAAGHLVARLDLALHRDEDLDELHHAGGQFVAALQLLDLVEEPLLETLLLLVVLGALGARLGGARILPAALRVGFWGVAAMGATSLLGSLFNVRVV
jgi:hypothetical protein